MPGPVPVAAAPARIDIRDGFGWRRLQRGPVGLWFKGHLHGSSPETLATELAAARGAEGTLAGLLCALNGHFAFAAEGPGWAVAAVDRVRSTPLFLGETEAGLEIAEHAPRLARKLVRREIDPDAALALAMAGYTIGTDTLCAGLAQLAPGEAVLSAGSGSPTRHRYHRYEPWRVVCATDDRLRRRLAEVTLAVIERLARSAEGRTIAIPLSAGNDSRLIASALARIGHRPVVCFAYGLPGNFEAAASRKIAERLGFPWRFWPHTPRSQGTYFASSLHRAYLDYADTCSAVPFVQDLPAVQGLAEAGFLPDDAIIVNGATGDFISGNHIVAPLTRPRTDLTADRRRRLVLDCAIHKHFRLWQSLATPANDERIARRLDAEIAPIAGALEDAETTHGVYEALEFENRQCKYVNSGQRIYEFLGFDWRLPLWDGDYLDFWERVPLAAKAHQRLYREMLEEQNWGGVWQGEAWRFPRTVSPAWMRYLVRPVCKALHAPLGRESWHRFERRYLQYWMDVTCNAPIVAYGVAMHDRRGARHAVAWLTEAYLASHGVRYDGAPLGAEGT